MISVLFILGVIILVAMVILIQRDLSQLEALAKITGQPVPESPPEPEPDPDPTYSFQDDRIVTGQLLPITEQHCRASGGKGKRKDWKKKPKGKRRDWEMEVR